MVAANVLVKTTVVNPAFLQEVKDSNPDLNRALTDLRQLLSSREPTYRICCRLTRLLDELRDLLALQFSLEESYGYLEVVGDPDESIGNLASQTQSEHGLLYMAVSDLAQQAEELQYRGVEANHLLLLLQRTRAFDLELREHESAESELIERSYGLR